MACTQWPARHLHQSLFSARAFTADPCALSSDPNSASSVRIRSRERFHANRGFVLCKSLHS
jgi:hypothetical protein